ncbi:uncharacterized protein LOC124497285 isoform X2 [Dermatophagoides farinae]|nr:uncharacterized protein LOC124496379 [Dermatophagoides farinae]XP_046915854.1 uncharacterized protein LOC124496379 [Dermatophagoides farinae]XP_046915855.1 uncharacterized protein LOC124496379 [Dermatophagoides farinae]KAH7638262.1 hypothetical protein HUG17_9368 [Dermatophagoides farinae]
MDKIHSPYLRMFVLLHGASGLQLLPISIHDLRSLIYLIINLSLNSITINCVFYDSPLSHAINRAQQQSSHKLYGYYLRTAFYFVYPIIYICFISNYLICGYRIIQLLDSHVFIRSTIMIDSSTNRWKAFGIFIATKLFWIHWFFINEPYWIANLVNHFKWKTFSLVLGLYLYHIYHLTTWFLLYYHQIITNLTLKQIDQMLTTATTIKTNSFSLEKRLFRSFQKLSRQNQKIQFSTSFLLSIMFIEQTIFTVSNLSYFFLVHFKGGDGAWHFLSIYSYLTRFIICFGLIEINRQNLQLFDHIEKRFNCKVIQNGDGASGGCSLRFCHFNQLQLYRQYFCLSAFQWLQIDAITAMQMFFFSLSYVTIISLT